MLYLKWHEHLQVSISGELTIFPHIDSSSRRDAFLHVSCVRTLAGALGFLAAGLRVCLEAQL